MHHLHQNRQKEDCYLKFRQDFLVEEKLVVYFQILPFLDILFHHQNHQDVLVQFQMDQHLHHHRQ
jgi:hypothetical protein